MVLGAFKSIRDEVIENLRVMRAIGRDVNVVRPAHVAEFLDCQTADENSVRAINARDDSANLRDCVAQCVEISLDLPPVSHFCHRVLDRQQPQGTIIYDVFYSDHGSTPAHSTTTYNASAGISFTFSPLASSTTAVFRAAFLIVIVASPLTICHGAWPKSTTSSPSFFFSVAGLVFQPVGRSVVPICTRILPEVFSGLSSWDTIRILA